VVIACCLSLLWAPVARLFNPLVGPLPLAWRWRRRRRAAFALACSVALIVLVGRFLWQL
jgi:hypothetical protein